MHWTVLGETHGNKKDLERASQALNAASPRTALVFLEALPVGRFVDGENAWRVAANFASPDPDQNEYVILARACVKRGIRVYGLERTSHRIPSCYARRFQDRVRCAVHRACTPSKKHCIESDWVDDIWSCDGLTEQSRVVIIVGKLHEAPLRRRLAARCVLERERFTTRR